MSNVNLGRLDGLKRDLVRCMKDKDSVFSGRSLNVLTVMVSMQPRRCRGSSMSIGLVVGSGTTWTALVELLVDGFRI